MLQYYWVLFPNRWNLQSMQLDDSVVTAEGLREAFQECRVLHPGEQVDYIYVVRIYLDTFAAAI